MRPFFKASSMLRAALRARPPSMPRSPPMTKQIATSPRTGPARDGSRRGGARPGSGRKPSPTTLVVNDFHQTARDLIGPRLPMLIEEVFALAMGVKVVEIGPDGKPVEHYTVPPDFRANEYLINRLLG